MNQQFEYQKRDLPFLRKDLAFRIIFSMLFFAIFIWQFTTFLPVVQNEENIVKLVVGSIVLLSSLLMFFIAFLYVFKDVRTIQTVKKFGRCSSRVQVMFDLKKGSFIRLYRFVTNLITLATSLVLVASITYAILQYNFMTSVSYYMPLLAVICLSGYNSVFHIREEIKIVQNVQAINSIY